MIRKEKEAPVGHFNVRRGEGRKREERGGGEERGFCKTHERTGDVLRKDVKD
jgi:hypothetical protein